MQTTRQRVFQLLHFVLFGITVISIVLFCASTIAVYTPKHWSFESKAELERIRTELPLAEARWKAHRITDYEIDVHGVSHPMFCYNLANDDFLPWHLKIRQGEIIFENDSQKRNVEEECHISNFLPPKVFDTIRQEIKKAEPDNQYLKIEFDAEYGFMSTYYLTSNNSVSSLNIGYTFNNFRPKTP